MSSEFYFQQWKETLRRLDHLVQVDLDYQKSKYHDKTLCEAVKRLNSMLGQYIRVHNDALECFQQNLQVQKTGFIVQVVKAVINRILELKHDIKKLECSNIQFLGHALTDHRLTSFDAALTDFLPHLSRSVEIQILIKEAIKRAEEKKEMLLKITEEEEKESVTEQIVKWWEGEEGQSETQAIEIINQESEESVFKRQMAALIQAHERSRQLIEMFTHQKQKREMWKKELMGTLRSQAPYELRERSAKLMQEVFRAFFEIKRNKKKQCQENEILGVRLCEKFNKGESEKADQMKFKRMEKRKIFEQEWMQSCEKLKEDFMKKNTDDLADHYRDFIRDWFRKWFDDIQYFHDIPKETEGGSVLIMKGELPDPEKWWEEYQTYLEDKKANKNKSALEKKYAELQAKEEEMIGKREELMRKKHEATLMRKLMKNPTLHPGFQYPHSKKTEHILDVVDTYRKSWNDLDFEDTLDVKQKFVRVVDTNDVYAKVKMEIMQTVDDDMRKELKLLKNALRTDYLNNDEKMPEPMKVSNARGKRKKKKKVKGIKNTGIAEQMEDLAFRGILKQYPKTKIEDFQGDYNYAGDDIRCKYEPASQFSGELRAVWWDICREAGHGFHQFLIVGPRLSGKTLLVHALATVHDAVLFELNLTDILESSPATTDLNHIVRSVVACARAAQPSVIYIRHVHRLYYTKVPPEEAIQNADVVRRILIRKLCKKIQKSDVISVIGTCIDPWQTKSEQLLKQFPAVVLIPDTSYSAVMLLLKQWVDKYRDLFIKDRPSAPVSLLSNHSLPRDLDICSLAYVLRGYSYGYLKEALTEFLTPERIVKIAAKKLSPLEIYGCILDNESEEKVEYEKYTKWYYEKTQSGHKEQKHIREQQEFKQAIQLFEERARKKKKIASAVSSAATMHSMT